ncbi:hypothetical protein [Propionibacterium australiense]|uniref:hypothetical protein n=1 Tax=Propionibacterium australiense TaxID=119981 RepID=UPI000E5B75ED|nr:hypothetical protein [Propionibacterium australiense]RLP10566.1 hypothetical protein D9T14_04755 [Propionibacterium australiense]
MVGSLLVLGVMGMDRWRVGLVAVGLCSVLMLAGCGRGDSPGPGGSSVGSSPVSSGPVSSSPSLTEDELYAEAERVYRAYFELEQQAFLEGGVNGVPAEMNEYIMGRYAKGEASMLADLAERQVKMQPGTRSGLTILDQRPADPPDDSVIELAVCIDSTISPLIDSSGNYVSGGFDVNNLFFKYDTDGALKIFGSNGETVDSCPAS